MMLSYPLSPYIDALDRSVSIALLASGGVDSAVACALLVRAGFRPKLFYINIGMKDEGFTDCTREEDLEMVALIARKYGLEYEEVDLNEAYWERVVSYTIDSVKRGLTPNPDVMCNRFIKFGVFEERFGYAFDYIASGHYASTVVRNGKVYLGTAPDPVKDQTDFLAQINLKQISKILFPIGTLDKSQVRAIAEEEHLPNAHRKDSQGICFLGKINYNDFLEKYLGKKKGDIIEFETGNKIGEHDGFWFHTIGQRKGLGLSGGPWFVVRKDCPANILYVSRGYDPETQYGYEVWCRDFHFITENPFTAGCPNPLPVALKVRHTPEFFRATLAKEGDVYHIVSEQRIQGIAPGQFAVVYDPDCTICLGSGRIEEGR